MPRGIGVRKIGIIPSWILSIAVAGLVMAAIFILVPNFTSSPGHRIAPGEIRVLDAAPYSQVRRPSVNDPEIYLNRQFSKRQTMARQFSYVFDPEGTAPELAIFAPIVGGLASVSINGAPFTRSQPQKLSAYGFGAAYIFAEINTRYFHPGSNRIDIILPEDTRRTGLRSLYVGDANQLEPVQKRYDAWLETLKNTGLLNGLIGMICAVLGLLLGGHRTAMLGGFVLSGMIIFHSTGLVSLPALAQPITSAGVIFLGALLLFIGLGRNGIRNAALVKGLSLTALIGAVIGLYLILSPGNVRSPITLTSMGVMSLFPVLFAGLPLILSSDVVAFREQVRLAEEEARRKDAIISDQQKALSREIEQKAVMEERQRFTRDMHDGIGGQLLSLLVRVRSGRVGIEGIETEIQSGINDLRLVVDSLDHVGDDLSAALVTFQSRARAQFEAQNISLEWIQSEKVNADRFGTRRILNLYRFLQEAVSNILRHADAQNVRIDIYPDAQSDMLRIIVEDDGKGLPEPKKNKAGKGIKNMKSRAEKLGGTLGFDVPETGHGTRLELIIPQDNAS